MTVWSPEGRLLQVNNDEIIWKDQRIACLTLTHIVLYRMCRYVPLFSGRIRHGICQTGLCLCRSPQRHARRLGSPQTFRVRTLQPPKEIGGTGRSRVHGHCWLDCRRAVPCQIHAQRMLESQVRLRLAHSAPLARGRPCRQAPTNDANLRATSLWRRLARGLHGCSDRCAALVPNVSQRKLVRILCQRHWCSESVGTNVPGKTRGQLQRCLAR